MANDEQQSANGNAEKLPQDSGANNAENNEAWSGNEQTLVGLPSKNKEVSDRFLVVVPDENSSDWLGSEQTMLPASSPKTGDGAESWTGTEQTLVGGITPAAATRKPVTAEDEQWLGNDATIIGTPSPQAKPTGDKGATTAGGGRKTHSTMDDGWHLKGRQGPLTGQTMGDYEIGGILGEGGMGTVYRAKQISLKRRVALKVLPPNLASNAQLRQRFEQEATTASLLNSPHVVQVFAAGSHNDLVYFVMEFVEGTDLSEKIREKNDAAQLFTPDEAANFVVQAARGLAEAGKHNIVHRDIKPANLMITAKGVVKIADFGISKIAGEHGLTMTGTAVGTPAYCSPEQGRGDKVDVRADIYSLGVVFYELLTGRKPFDGATANALIYQHNYAEPTLITALRAEVPDAYQAVALKCLQKDPAKRYQDAAELVADLERVRAGSAPMTALMNAFGTGADEAMRRLGIKQRKMWPYISAALVLVALIAGIVVWQVSSTAEQQAELAEVARLRGNLAVLDRAQPVPQSSRDDLAALAHLVASEDTDLVRWQGKLQRLTLLQERLARLDGENFPAAIVRQEAVTDLDRYREDVGGDGEDVQRWQARINATVAQISTLRKNLSELDQVQIVSATQAERLSPVLTQLIHLAGEYDEDAKRWKSRMGTSLNRIKQLREDIKILDSDKIIISIINLEKAEKDLSALQSLVGNEDAQVRAGFSALQLRKERVVAMRTNLQRLDAVEWVTVGLQAAVAEDLSMYAKLVENNDSDLQRWQRKVTDSQNRLTNLRTLLARLDNPDSLTISEQATAQEHLAEYRGLVSRDDGQLQSWDTRLRTERDAIGAMQATLIRFDNPTLMTLVEWEAAEKAVANLGRLGALSESQQRLCERRLLEEKQQLFALRQSLITRDTAGAAIGQQLASDLNLLAKIVGETDPDVQRWRARVNEYERLRTVLILLDKPTSLPAEVEKPLQAYAAIVGVADLDVQRWQAKINRVRALQRDLAPLDAVAPLPEEAVIKTQALVSEVGADDPQAALWFKKAQRTQELTSELTESTMNAYILPEQAIKMRRELVQLVGLEDEQVAELVTRVTILQGPGQPSWASASGRDDYGLWADLTINGITQRFRYIPAGSFVMGSPENESGRERDETQVPVTISRSFWLADTECIQSFWHAIMNNNPSRFVGLESPVERVSWDEAKNFCVALSKKINGLTARLPTEAEWEYACRSGLSAPFASYLGAVGHDKLDTIAWFKGTTPTTQGVKRRFGNVLGLFDMHGNVWEWCEDRYGTYSPTAVTDPIGREQETRVARGGSWGDAPDKIRAANRLAVRQDMRTLYLGLRIAAQVEWPMGQPPTAANAVQQMRVEQKKDQQPALIE
jgi:formylglycine-generating enzyme required for sulfatase activity/tRNA A-37 threonylcarbamoyl transferase component Bud32/succinate dehydrogenase flavin-adding protein (antitoxin of CptAB toxin-antitoxin module)